MGLFNLIGDKFLKKPDEMESLGNQNTAGKLFGGISQLGGLGPASGVAGDILGGTLPEMLFSLLGKKKKEEEQV